MPTSSDMGIIGKLLNVFFNELKTDKATMRSKQLKQLQM